MNRRYFLLFVSGGVGMGAAGCLGTGQPTDSPEATGDSDADEDPTGSHTPTVPQEGMGRIDVNEVEELQFLGWVSSVISEENLFQIQTIIRNVGDQTTTITRYEIDTAVYDESGTELESESYPTNFAIDEIGPDDAVTVTTGRTLEDPERVARYTISLRCSTANKGVYGEK